MIDDNVAMPEEQAKPKSRARKPKAMVPSPAQGLIDALKFISVAQKKTGPPEVQFSMICGGWIAASNGIITVATPVQEDLTACPHTTQFLDALTKCGQDLVITQLSSNTISVKSDKFKGLIPCLTMDSLQITGPDPQIAPLTEAVKSALGAVAAVAVDGSAMPVYASVLLQAGSCVATDGAAIVEAWHGTDLPPNLLLPRAAAIAVAKCNKLLSGFGFSTSSVTFYFSDGSWLKTQLYDAQYPNYKAVLDVEGLNPWALQPDFFKAVKMLEGFTKDGNVYFGDGLLYTDIILSEASTYHIEGLPQGLGFGVQYLLKLEPFMQTVHFNPEGRSVHFFGDKVRGALMALDMPNTSN